MRGEVRKGGVFFFRQGRRDPHTSSAFFFHFSPPPHSLFPRDAMEACKNLSPEDEAACMLQHGCDAGAVHARLDGEDGAAAATAAGEAGKAAAV